MFKSTLSTHFVNLFKIDFSNIKGKGNLPITNTTQFSTETYIMTRYSTFTRHRIHQLYAAGLPRKEIQQALSRDGVDVSLSGLSLFLKKIRDGSGMVDKQRPGRTSKVTPEIRAMIDGKLHQNNELTADDLQRVILLETGNTIPIPALKRARKRLGWDWKRTRFCQQIRLANRPKRFEFARRCLRNRDTFSNVIWSDECSVQLDHHTRKSFQKKNTPAILKGKPKHPYKVHVWAGISKRGATSVVIFTGNMDATFYCNEIVRKWLKPFLLRVFPEGHRFQQDNDPKHTSKLAIQTFKDLKITWWKTPAESPDINPIENLWAELKGHIRKYAKPTTKDELIQAINTFWSTKVTPEKCRKYISHVHKVLPKVLERQGQASGY